MASVRCKVAHAVVGCEVEVDDSIFEFFRKDSGTMGHISPKFAPTVILADEGLVFIVPFVLGEDMIEAHICYLVPDPKGESPGPLMTLWQQSREHGPYPTFEAVAAACERANSTMRNRELN